MVQDFDPDKAKMMADLEREMYEKIEEARQGFYYFRYQYMMDRKSGERYNAVLIAEGKEEADRRAEAAEERFAALLKSARLTPDGKSTINEVPIDRMLLGELRRVRAATSMTVFDFMTRFRRWIAAAPELSRGILELALSPFLKQYEDLYLQYHMLIDVDLLQAMPPWAVNEFLMKCAERHGELDYKVGPLESKSVRASEYDKITANITKELNEFLMGHIPTRIEELETRRMKLLAVPDAEPPKLLH